MKQTMCISLGWRWLAAIAVAGLVSACGGGGQSPILGVGDLGVVDLTPPAVTVVSPLVGATGVAPNTAIITATFSKAMDPASITNSSFTLTCPTLPAASGGTVTYAAATHVATRSVPVALPLETCTATVTTAVKDSNGIAMLQNYEWQFTVAGAIVPTPPTVTVVSPLPGATGVSTNTAIVTAAFSKAMDPTSITNSSFTLTCPSSSAASGGTVTYAAATHVATRSVPASSLLGICTATVTTAVKDVTGVLMLANYSWQFTTGAVADTTRPTVVTVNPADLATNVATNSPVIATFSEAMNPLSITATQFTVSAAGVNIAGAVSLSPLGKIATFQPAAALLVDTSYTATVTNLAADLAGNTLLANKVWTFRTAALATVGTGIDLITAAPFGTFGGTAGMTNQGTLTVINGDIGTIATATDSITGFHDAANIYTQTGSNIGNVTGKIFTCTNSTTGTNSAGPSAPDCAVATQARLDAQTAYLALAARPVVGASPAPGENLAGVTLQAGTYKAPSGKFLIEGGDLTLTGDANAVWVFQMASTLTVGGPGAAAPQSIILAGGALAKNVFWQVGSAATINAGGGGTMVGTIIAQDGVTFSTVGNVALVTLNGRALSLGASVTMVNTVVNVPAP